MSKTLSFSIGLYDNDGDKYDSGIFIHVDGNLIIRFGDISELEKFSKDIDTMLSEIKSHVE